MHLTITSTRVEAGTAFPMDSMPDHFSRPNVKEKSGLAARLEDVG